MRPLFPWPLLCCPVLMGLLLGCSRPSAQGTAKKRAAASEASGVGESGLPGVADVGESPKLGDYLPPLDKGRVEVAVPEGWHVPPANSKYVVRFTRSDADDYPTVVVTAEDYQGQVGSTVTKENVRKFAEEVARELKKERSAVQPFQVGDFVGVRYRKRGPEPGRVSGTIEALFLDTVVEGRKYSIHLRAREGSLEQELPYLYAVVGGIKFVGRQSATQAQAEERSDEAEKPAAQTEEEGKVGEESKQEGEKPAGEKPEEPGKKPKTSGDGELDLDKLDELLKKP